MTTFERLTRNEQVLLLGFLPLLGATTHAGAALIGTVIVVLGLWVLRRVATRIGGRFESASAWAVYAALGYGLAYLVTAVMTFVLPVPESTRIYLHLSGLTPLVFIGVSPDRSRRERIAICLRFAGLMALFGVVRESLGHGTLFGMPLWPSRAIPFGLLATSAGAFIVFAAAACSRAVFIRPDPAQPEAGL